jgi:hypothetical protein
MQRGPHDHDDPDDPTLSTNTSVRDKSNPHHMKSWPGLAWHDKRQLVVFGREICADTTINESKHLLNSSDADFFVGAQSSCMQKLLSSLSQISLCSYKRSGMHHSFASYQ